MDATLAQPSGLIAWVSTYGQIVYFFAQIIFWAGLLVLFAYALVQYKRWVNYQMGVGKSGKLRLEQEAGSGEAPAGEKVAVDEFVE